MNEQAIKQLEEWATMNGAHSITIETRHFIWSFDTTTDTLQPTRVRVVTTGYVTPRKHDLTLQEATRALHDPEYAKSLYQQLQEAHTEKWTQYYKEWKSKKTPEERQEQDEKRRQYQRVYQRELRRKKRLEQEEFNKRGN